MRIKRVDIAVVISVLTLAVSILFIGYALSGADLCVWCGSAPAGGFPRTGVA